MSTKDYINKIKEVNENMYGFRNYNTVDSGIVTERNIETGTCLFIGEYVPVEPVEELGGVMVYRDPDNGSKKKALKNFSIHIDIDKKHFDGFKDEPYVKICNAKSWADATESARIDLKTGKIYDHSDGKGSMSLNNKEAQYVHDILKKGTCNNGKYKGKKIIDAIYTDIEREAKERNIDYKRPEDDKLLAKSIIPRTK